MSASFTKGRFEHPPFEKGGLGGISKTMLQYNKKLKPLARELRKNMTDAENLLWSRIRRKQLKSYQFYRQKMIGNYIVDFYCPKGKLVIELDGSQHYTDDAKIKDEKRDRFLNRLGLRVLRFTNLDVLKNINAVLDNLASYLK